MKKVKNYIIYKTEKFHIDEALWDINNFVDCWDRWNGRENTIYDLDRVILNLVKQSRSKSELYLTSSKEEQQLYDDVRQILQTARNSAYKSVNSIMSKAYWEIGERIVQQEQNGTGRAKYGDYIIRNLSKELSGEFGTGFSIANLKNCRQFYRTFPKNSIGYTACSQLSWSHLRNIMRLDSEEERNYYIQEAIRGSWSVKTLERNIKSGYYKEYFLHNYKIR